MIWSLFASERSTRTRFQIFRAYEHYRAPVPCGPATLPTREEARELLEPHPDGHSPPWAARLVPVPLLSNMDRVRPFPIRPWPTLRVAPRAARVLRTTAQLYRVGCTHLLQHAAAPRWPQFAGEPDQPGPGGSLPLRLPTLRGLAVARVSFALISSIDMRFLGPTFSHEVCAPASHCWGSRLLLGRGVAGVPVHPTLSNTHSPTAHSIYMHGEQNAPHEALTHATPAD